jgi:mannose-6-phosphate isomerase-like protein (cupin superfamily)
VSRKIRSAGGWDILLRAAICQVALVTVQPGAYRAFEIHAERDEWHALLAGSARLAEFSGDTRELTGDRLVLVPALKAHALYTEGPEPALVLVLSTQTHEPHEDRGTIAIEEDE